MRFTQNHKALFLHSLCLMALVFLCMSIQAQKKKSKNEVSETTQADSTKDQKEKIKNYTDIITSDAVTDSGLFITHQLKGKYYFEIPEDILDREILVVSRIAGITEGLSFGGAGMKSRPQQVIRWQRMGNKILLRSVSHNNVASLENPAYESVRNNNFEPIIMAFDISTFSEDSSAYVIDVASLFTTDVAMIGALSKSQRKNFEVKSLDKDRSMITSMKSFPQNVEVRHILTYNASDLPSNEITQTLSLEMNQSFVLLPEEPMMARIYDQRVGFFRISQVDYSADEQKAYKEEYITRWRLEPSDMEAFNRGELVEPVKPIVYYVDPATPVKWRKYIKQGIEDWQKAFEAAGFKNAILAKDPPSKEEDPDWSPEDVRYSVVRYITTTIQNAQGPHVHDPRSGEILESDILWYHNVMNLLRNWYFIQTAAVDPEARKVKFDDALMGELIRFVAAHEVGHTLGFPHNMGSSAAYPVDSMRSPTFTQTRGTAPSIMDYARFNYIAQPEDEGVNLMPAIGKYDIYAVKWGYRPIPGAKTPEEEQDTLNAWIEARADDPVYRFGKQMSDPLDPSSQTEDLGDNSVKASMYGIQNLKRIVPNLIAWTEAEGKDYADLEELYGQVLSQYNRYMGHVKTNVGGVYEWYKTYDQEGPVYEHVPKERQEEAVAFLNKELFETPEWMIDEDILRRVEPAGVVERIRAVQERTLKALFDFSRLARLLEAEALYGKESYTMLDLCHDTREGIWSELEDGDEIDTYRRNIQRAYIELMETLMKEEQSPVNGEIRRYVAYTPVDVSQSDIRALARANLKQLQNEIQQALPRFDDEMSRYHLEDAQMRIDMILDPRG